MQVRAGPGDRLRDPLAEAPATLIDDGDGDDRSELVLTAAHGIASERMWVSFDHDLEIVPGWDSRLVPGADVLHAGTAHPHPKFACCGANDAFDIAVVVLDEEIEGSPAPIASAGQLDAMSGKELRSTVFTAVGYGGVRDSRKTAWQGIRPTGHIAWTRRGTLSAGGPSDSIGKTPGGPDRWRSMSL